MSISFHPYINSTTRCSDRRTDRWGAEDAGPENDGPMCKIWNCRTWECVQQTVCSTAICHRRLLRRNIQGGPGAIVIKRWLFVPHVDAAYPVFYALMSRKTDAVCVNLFEILCWYRSLLRDQPWSTLRWHLFPQFDEFSKSVVLTFKRCLIFTTDVVPKYIDVL